MSPGADGAAASAVNSRGSGRESSAAPPPRLRVSSASAFMASASAAATRMPPSLTFGSGAPRRALMPPSSVCPSPGSAAHSVANHRARPGTRRAATSTPVRYACMAAVAAPPGEAIMAGSAHVRDRQRRASPLSFGSAAATVGSRRTTCSQAAMVLRHHGGWRSGSVWAKADASRGHLAIAGRSSVTVMRTRSSCVSEAMAPRWRRRASTTRVAVLISSSASACSRAGPTEPWTATSAPATAATPPRRARRAQTRTAKPRARA